MFHVWKLIGSNFIIFDDIDACVWCLTSIQKRYPKIGKHALLYCLPNKCTLDLVLIYSSSDHSYEENILLAHYINCKQKNHNSSHILRSKYVPIFFVLVS